MKIVISVSLTAVDSRQLAEDLAEEIREVIDTLLRSTDFVEHGEISANLVE